MKIGKYSEMSTKRRKSNKRKIQEDTRDNSASYLTENEKNPVHPSPNKRKKHSVRSHTEKLPSNLRKNLSDEEVSENFKDISQDYSMDLNVSSENEENCNTTKNNCEQTSPKQNISITLSFLINHCKKKYALNKEHDSQNQSVKKRKKSKRCSIQNNFENEIDHTDEILERESIKNDQKNSDRDHGQFEDNHMQNDFILTQKSPKKRKKKSRKETITDQENFDHDHDDHSQNELIFSEKLSSKNKKSSKKDTESDHDNPKYDHDDHIEKEMIFSEKSTKKKKNTPKKETKSNPHDDHESSEDDHAKNKLKISINTKKKTKKQLSKGTKRDSGDDHENSVYDQDDHSKNKLILSKNFENKTDKSYKEVTEKDSGDDRENSVEDHDDHNENNLKFSKNSKNKTGKTPKKHTESNSKDNHENSTHDHIKNKPKNSVNKMENLSKKSTKSDFGDDHENSEDNHDDHSENKLKFSKKPKKNSKNTHKDETKNNSDEDHENYDQDHGDHTKNKSKISINFISKTEKSSKRDTKNDFDDHDEHSKNKLKFSKNYITKTVKLSKKGSKGDSEDDQEISECDQIQNGSKHPPKSMNKEKYRKKESKNHDISSKINHEVSEDNHENFKDDQKHNNSNFCQKSTKNKKKTLKQESKNYNGNTKDDQKCSEDDHEISDDDQVQNYLNSSKITRKLPKKQTKSDHIRSKINHISSEDDQRSSENNQEEKNSKCLTKYKNYEKKSTRNDHVSKKDDQEISDDDRDQNYSIISEKVPKKTKKSSKSDQKSTENDHGRSKDDRNQNSSKFPKKLQKKQSKDNHTPYKDDQDQNYLIFSEKQTKNSPKKEIESDQDSSKYSQEIYENEDEQNNSKYLQKITNNIEKSPKKEAESDQEVNFDDSGFRLYISNSPDSSKSDEISKNTSKSDSKGLDSLLNNEIDLGDFFNESDSTDLEDFVDMHEKPPVKSNKKHLKNDDFSELPISYEDTLKLKELDIIIDFEVPKLHSLLTRCTGIPKYQRDIIDKENIPFKSGKFSKEEDETIKNNWYKFIEIYGLEDKPELFFSFRNKNVGVLLNDNQKKYFVYHLSRNLPDRAPTSVYTRFKRIFMEKKKGRFDEKEDQVILDYLKTSKSATPYVDLARILNRTSFAVEKRVKLLQKGFDTKIKWDRKMISKFLKHLLQITDSSDLEQLKAKEITSEQFQKLSEKLGGIPVKRLRRAWRVAIYPKIFVEKNLNMCNVKKKLVESMIKNGENDWRTVDWQSYAENFAGMTAEKLYIVFKTLATYYVPETKTHSLKAVLKCLSKILDDNFEFGNKQTLTKMEIALDELV